MNEKKLREELYSFYLSGDEERCKAFSEKCYAKMNKRFRDGMSVTFSAPDNGRFEKLNALFLNISKIN